ncbi:hypothetical protein KO566_11005 [Flavobacteriaceae bacterium XHP0103]|uniref:hypothetical protein n=1 Tax=Marixanthotalea marina TaxID=2844359 RepID=UPI002989B6C0|nr:hypothetical protein [Marixanthotalea marina]MBU3822593.1 hypothetical protein [Marixanthotalea marina]
MHKYRKLFLGILFDAIGYVSYLFPGFGEFTDILWAPLSGWLMTKMYKGKAGKVAGVVTFVEEALPGMDFIPTFTIMWIYTFVFNKKETIIEVE